MIYDPGRVFYLSPTVNLSFKRLKSYESKKDQHTLNQRRNFDVGFSSLTIVVYCQQFFYEDIENIHLNPFMWKRSRKPQC